MASDLDIAARAVEQGLLEQSQLEGCVAERRRQLNDGLDTSLRELLFERGLLDAARWGRLSEAPRPVAETRSEAPAATMSPPPAPEPQQEVLGGYRIVSELGRGAMGVVYEAVQEGLNRRVALKVLPEFSALQGVARERFQREAQATASLKHPGIVPIYDIGEDRGIHFFAMELLEERTLKEILERDGPLPPLKAAKLAKLVAEALEFAHANGVIHRDVKPDNVILRSDGEPVVTDFGLARQLTDQSLTREGVIVGTPLYMSPEQAAGDGQPLDHRVDVYGLGVTLYELVAGRVPFESARDTGALLDMVTHEEPPPLRRVVPDVPAPLAAIVEVAMEKNPARRYASAGALAADLGRFLAGEPILARPPSALRRAVRRLRRSSKHLFVLGSLIGLILIGGAALRAFSQAWQADALVLEAHSLSQAGELDAARDRLTEALELRPGLSVALFRLGELSLLQGEPPEKAFAHFDAALRSDPRHTDALLGRGQLLRQQGRLAEALADFETAKSAASELDPRPALQGGIVLSALERPQLAIEWLREGLELARNARAARDALYAKSLRLLGELELDAGRPGKALPELEEAVRLDPGDVAPRLLLVRALLAHGNPEAAADAATMALVRDPKNLDARVLRARAQRHEGKFAQAHADLGAALERPSARLLRGLVRFEALDHQSERGPMPEVFNLAGAKADLHATVGDASLRDDEVALGRIALGWLSLLAPRPRRSPALREFDEAIARAPNSALARLSRGLLLLRWKRYDDAEADLLTAQGLEGGAYGARVGLARLALAKGDPEGARRNLDAAIVQEPERTTAYADRYRLRLAAQDPKALEDWARGLTLKSQRPVKAMRLRHDGDPFALAECASQAGFREFARAASLPGGDPPVLERAESWLTRALVFNPRGLSASARLASVTYLLGHVSQAAQAYARARTIDPSLVEAELTRAVVHRDLRGSEKGLVRAEELLRNALREAPPKPDLQGRLRFELAKTLRLQGRLDDALALLDEARTFTPKRYCVLAERVRLLHRLGREGVSEALDEATELFTHADRDRIRGALYAFAGERTRRQDNDPLALHFFTRAIEADPKSAFAWRGRSRINFRGSPEQIPMGLVDIFMAAELDPLYTSRFLELEGRLARFKHLLPLARGRVNTLMEDSPERRATLFVRGYLDFFAEDYAPALEWFSKAFTASGERSYFSLTFRAATLVRLGRLEEAERDLDRADQLFANGPVTAYWRACLHATRGEDAKVLAILEKIAKMNFLFPNQLRDLSELSRFQKHPRVLVLLETQRR